MSRGSQVKVKSKTWVRDKDELFDHCSSQTVANKLTLQGSAWVARSKNELHSIEEAANGLFRIELNGRGCILASPAPATPLWLSLSNTKLPGRQKKFRLGKGNVLRLGRLTLTVKELSGFANYSHLANSYNTADLAAHGLGRTPDPAAVHQDPHLDPQDACRICLCEEDEDGRGPVNACGCSGSAGLIHAQCLRKWLLTRASVKENGNVREFSWKELKCELCKVEYPYTIQAGNIVHRLLPLEPPAGKSLILQGRVDAETRTVFYVLALDRQRRFGLGRDSQSAVNASTLTVSRVHAELIVKKSGVYIKDRQSTFGTLVRVDKPLRVNPKHPVTVQCGRSVVSVSTKQAWSMVSCMCGSQPRKVTHDWRTEDV